MDDQNRNEENMEGAPINKRDGLDDQNVVSDIDSPNDIAAYSNRDEETAAELTADDINISDVDDDNVNVNSSVGWVALVLSALSLFWLPIVLGGAGIIVGFIARNRGAETLGNIAIGIGALSIIIRLFVMPFV